jgi:hypothetical protein
LIFVFGAISLLACLSPLAQARKIRERGGSSIPSRTGASGDEGIPTEGDSSLGITIHSRRHSARGDSADIVRIGESITIGANQVIDGDVVSVGGSVTVLGRVLGDVVSVGGDVDLRPQAVVEGDAVSIGGTVHRGEGSQIGGQNVGLRFVPSGFLGAWTPGRHFPVFSIVWIGMKLIFLFLVAWILAMLAEARLLGTGRFLEAHLWRSLLTGLAVLILFPAAFILLCVTIVGIPVALLSPLALVLALMVGYLVVAALVGQRVIKGSDHTSWIKATAVGLALFEGLPLVGHLLRAAGGPFHALGLSLIVFGWAAIMISATIGLGALVSGRFGKRSPLFVGEAPVPAAGTMSP